MTVDIEKLEALAKAAPTGPWYGPDEFSHKGMVFDCDLGSLLSYESIESERDACVAYVAAANPAAVLELTQRIANLELLQTFSLGVSGIIKSAASELGFDAAGEDSALDYLIGLARKAGALRVECEALRKDKDRMDALEGNFWDVRHSSEALADTGDYTSGVEVIGHWMDKPFERVIGENYTESLRAAIDQAMTADAYPPARPDYSELDAAMSKEAAQ